jgi:hypothetical protein
MSRDRTGITGTVGRRGWAAATIVAASLLAVGGCGGDQRAGTTGTGTATAPSVVAVSTAPSTAPNVPSGVTDASPPAVDPADQPTGTDCKAADLTLAVGDGDAAAGTVYRPLRFTNSGSRVCTIQGFPGVSYVAGTDGHQVGPAAFRDGTKGAVVTLQPGQVAAATVGFVNVRNYDAGACQPTQVLGIRVYPPHDTAAMFVPMDGLGCLKTPPGNQLTVRTVNPGANG